MNDLKASIVPGLLAMVGVKGAELLGVTSTAGKLFAAAALAIGGVYLSKQL
jgi:hypothetical protein